MRGVPRGEPYPHGTRARYKHGPCRCEECRAANAAYQRARRLRNAYGRNPWVDAEPVRRHVRRLMAPHPGSPHGIGRRRIASLAGVSAGVVSALLYVHGVLPPSRRIHEDHASALLRVRAETSLRAPGACVDSCPSMRLVECMARHGISKRWIARALGIRYPGVHLSRTITLERADALAELHWSFFARTAEFRRTCECPLPREIERWLEEAS